MTWRPGDGYVFTGGWLAPDVEPDPVPGQLRTASRNRNGMPEPVSYRRSAEDTARDREVAEFVAYAQARADAMPGAVPRCTNCRKPGAECICDGGVPT